MKHNFTTRNRLYVPHFARLEIKASVIDLYDIYGGKALTLAHWTLS